MTTSSNPTLEHHVVIGANYGDEGKGLVTDYLTRKHNVKTVARFNGGAQAGHTVVDEDSRHVFHSYSSGTFAGASTLLLPTVVVNPRAILEEGRALGEWRQPISLTWNSPVTTPIDVLLNQEAEIARGGKRHGSCGYGINETVTRHAAGLSVKNIGANFPYDLRYWEWLMTEWVPRRARELGIDWRTVQRMIDWGWNQRSKFHDEFHELDRLKHGVDSDVWRESMVFEGAQGLALDEFIGEFPYVTRSECGIGNVLRELNERINPHSWPRIMNIYYVTRAYHTRHGHGPLPHDMGATAADLETAITDNTNGFNDWQGKLRFAPLVLDDLRWRIHTDLQRNQSIPVRSRGRVVIRPHIVITCLDQQERWPVATTHDCPFTEIKNMTADELIDAVEQHCSVPVAFTSWGPSAKTIRERQFKPHEDVVEAV